MARWAYRGPRVGPAGERTPDDVRRTRAARPARNRDADHTGPPQLPARAHLSGAARDPAYLPQARQHGMEVSAVLHEPRALSARGASSAVPAPARAALDRVDVHAL